MEHSNSENLSKGDIISFIALLLLGVIVFFGMNFMTLGDKIPSIVAAILLFVVMMIFVFLAAHAKAQDRNQATWKKVEYGMLALYVLALIPCYICSAKFFDVQFGRKEIMQQVQKDINDIDKMFGEYNKKSESRCYSYQTELEALLKDDEGRRRIVQLLELKKEPEEVSQQDIDQATESFRDFLLKGRDYSALKAEKDNLIENCNINFKNWNIFFIPQYVSELEEAKTKYATELEQIFTGIQNPIEMKEPEFNMEGNVHESHIVEMFQFSAGFSILGLISIIIFGGLGLVKYLLGERSTVIPMEEGTASAITEDGGFTF